MVDVVVVVVVVDVVVGMVVVLVSGLCCIGGFVSWSILW